MARRRGDTHWILLLGSAALTTLIPVYFLKQQAADVIHSRQPAATVPTFLDSGLDNLLVEFTDDGREMEGEASRLDAEPITESTSDPDDDSAMADIPPDPALLL